MQRDCKKELRVGKDLTEPKSHVKITKQNCFLILLYAITLILQYSHVLRDLISASCYDLVIICRTLLICNKQPEHSKVCSTNGPLRACSTTFPELTWWINPFHCSQHQADRCHWDKLAISLLSMLSAPTSWTSCWTRIHCIFQEPWKPTDLLLYEAD